MARLKDVEVWSAVQDAPEVYLVEYRQLLAEGHRLHDERVRILRLVGNSERQSQFVECNRQLAARNERLSEFQGGHSS